MSKKLFYYGSTGVFNSRSFEFGGVNEYMTVPNNALLNPAGNFSFSFWVKFNNLPNKYDGIFDKYTGSTSGYICQFNGSRQPVFSIFTTADKSVSVTSFPINGVWYHVAATYDQSNLKIYFNGVLEGTTPATGVVVPNTHSLFFNGDGVSSFRCALKLDLVKYWNKALTLAEVAEDMVTDDARSSSMAANLVCFWAMGEGTGDDATGGTGVIKDLVSGLNATPQNTEAADLVADVH